MTSPQKHELILEEFTTPEEVQAALTDLTNRCNALPPAKQRFLAHTLRNNQIDVEVIALIVLMLENSDDDFNITSPELNELIAESMEAHDNQEAQ